MNATHATLSTGVIENQVKQTVATNNGTEVTTTSEKTASKWGEIALAKQDKRNQARLDGAEFQLFATKDDAEKNQTPLPSTARRRSPPAKST